MREAFLEQRFDREAMDACIGHQQEQRDRMQVVADRWTEIDERWDLIVDEILDEQ